jgi:hypothetical protein
MTYDRRSAYDEILGVRPGTLGLGDRPRAIRDCIARELGAQNYQAAQVYATLLLAETQQDSGQTSVLLTNWEDLAIAIAAHLAPELREIADASRR